MERKTRRVVFYCCMAGFVLAGAALTSYSFGYSFDYATLDFVKTGSFTLQVNTSADVLVNEQPAGETSLLNNSFSQARLLPRSYTVKVEKDGYFSWQKTVDIKAGYYLDFPRVVILPRELTETPVASGSFTMPAPADNKTVGEEIKYLDSPDGNKTLWSTDHELWVRWLHDSSEQPLKNAGDSELLTRYSGTIRDAQWFNDSAHLIVSVDGQLKFLEIDPRGGLNSYDLPIRQASLGSTFDHFYYDRDNNRLYLQKGQLLSQIPLP